MFLWISVIVLVVGSSQQRILQRAITKFSSNITMSNEDCGYLRHIQSGTCVGANSGTDRTLVGNDSLCSDQHFFCFNSLTGQVRTESEILVGGKVIGGSCDQDTVALYSANAPNINKEWRILNNGKIQSQCSCGTSDSGLMCWTRNSINIRLAKCSNATAGEESQQTELRRQQFDFQRKWKTEKSDEYSTLFKNRDLLRIYIQEKKHGPLPQYRFHINVDFYNASSPENSLGTLKLKARYFGSEKLKDKELSLSVINWNMSQRCSTKSNFVEAANGDKIDSQMLVWFNAAGQLNVHLDGKRADLKCWFGPWSDPVRIRVTAIDMMQSGQKSDELFNIRYKIDQITVHKSHGD
ncbi:hypothetical protein ACHWQZ_G019617 [Mnemiopsis leidyi]